MVSVSTTLRQQNFSKNFRSTETCIIAHPRHLCRRHPTSSELSISPIEGFTTAKTHDRSKLHSSHLERMLGLESTPPEALRLEAGAQMKKPIILKMNTFSSECNRRQCDSRRFNGSCRSKRIRSTQDPHWSIIS